MTCERVGDRAVRCAARIRRAAALALLLVGVGCARADEEAARAAAEAGEAAPAETAAEATAESVAEKPVPEPPAEAPGAEAAAVESQVAAEESGGEAAEAGAKEDVPPGLRQVYAVEFERPYSESDLEWLGRQGAHLMNRLNDRTVTVWFAPRAEHPWAADPRIKDVVPLMKRPR